MIADTLSLRLAQALLTVNDAAADILDQRLVARHAELRIVGILDQLDAVFSEIDPGTQPLHSTLVVNAIVLLGGLLALTWACQASDTTAVAASLAVVIAASAELTRTAAEPTNRFLQELVS